MDKLSYLLVLLSLVTTNIYVANSYTLTASYLTQLGYHNQNDMIEIYDNNITNIDPNAFNGYDNLWSLVIESGNITIIDLVVFKNISNLAHLSLFFSSLIKITNANNVKLPNLDTFSISGDMSKSIEFATNVTNGIGNITRLNLNVQLNPLKPNKFLGLNKLTSLYLMHGNQTTGITKSMFNGLTSLENFGSALTNIKTIDVHTFESLPNLKLVNVHTNLITSFEYLQIPNQLEELVLLRNNMNYFALSRTMGVLKTLDISANRFRSFRSMNFTFLANLTTLYLSDNPHAYQYEIPGHLKPLTKLENNIKLREIYMDYNKINSINNRSFIGPANLESVYLKYNNMIKIKTGTFNCSNIQTLMLDFNQITEIETLSFYGTNPITPITLGLYYNQIAQIGPSAFGNVNFYSLGLSNNQLTELNNLTFSGVEQIEYLYLSYNRISEIEPDTFANLKINNIYLEYNLLTELKNTTFAGMNQLEKVILDYNNLTTIEPGTFANLSNLKEVYLGNNHLTQLDSSIFSGSNNLTSIYLWNNPNLSSANFQSLCPPAAINCHVVY